MAVYAIAFITEQLTTILLKEEHLGRKKERKEKNVEKDSLKQRLSNSAESVNGNGAESLTEWKSSGSH